MNTFESYSTYYDLINSGKNYSGETQYIHELIKSGNKSVKNILEMGCGTGEHAGLLSELGYQITAIDRSEEMLSIARSKNNNRKIEFIQSDILKFNDHKQYDTVISLFHVMSYMTDLNMLTGAFNTVSKHLRTGGSFIFDCWHGPAVLKDHPISRTKVFEDAHIQVKRISYPEWKKELNMVNVDFEINVTDKIQNNKTTFHETHPMRYWFTNEVDQALNLSGMKLVKAEEWLTGNALTDDTWNACYIAVKTK